MRQDKLNLPLALVMDLSGLARTNRFEIYRYYLQKERIHPEVYNMCNMSVVLWK